MYEKHLKEISLKQRVLIVILVLSLLVIGLTVGVTVVDPIQEPIRTHSSGGRKL